MDLDPEIDIDVDEQVYNPSDDTYLLLSVAEVKPGDRFLEIGPGSGIISVHAAKLGAMVTSADISPYAVECTRRNALKNDAKVESVRSDLFENIKGSFDVIVFNPPYLPGETRSTSWIEQSWAGGDEGSEVAVRFLQEAWKHLAPEGRIFMILSSVGGYMTVVRSAKERYESVMLQEKHMFFESIFAYKFWIRYSADR